MTNFTHKRLKHRGFRNSETARVEKRIQSVVDAHRSRVTNSLAVESMECVVYKRVRAGSPCTCSLVEVDHDEGIDATSVMGGPRQEIRADVAPTSISGRGGVEISSSGAFGNMPWGGSTFNEMDHEVPDYKSLEVGSIIGSEGTYQDNTSDDMFQDHAMGGNIINCPICYREGYVPAFQPVGFNYQTLTTTNAAFYSGYRIVADEQPNVFEKVEDDGYVDFYVTVPKFFTTGTWSIRNYDGELLGAAWIPVIVDGKHEMPLTKATLERYRGRKAMLRIRAPYFSHCNVVFDLGARPLMANISSETQVLDYDKELTVSNLNIVLPYNAGNLQPQDILVLPRRKLVLMVTDAPMQRNAMNKTLEWSVATRTIQRKERIFNIHNGIAIK